MSTPHAKTVYRILTSLLLVSSAQAAEYFPPQGYLGEGTQGYAPQGYDGTSAPAYNNSNYGYAPPAYGYGQAYEQPAYAPGLGQGYGQPAYGNGYGQGYGQPHYGNGYAPGYSSHAMNGYGYQNGAGFPTAAAPAPGNPMFYPQPGYSPMPYTQPNYQPAPVYQNNPQPYRNQWHGPAASRPVEKEPFSLVPWDHMPGGEMPDFNPFSQGPFKNLPSKMFNTQGKDWAVQKFGDVWEDALNAPHNMGRLPGNFQAPSVSIPNPIDLGDQIGASSATISEEAPEVVQGWFD